MKLENCPLTMPSIPVVPIALAASLGGLYYVDKCYKDLMAKGTIEDQAAHDKSLDMKKKMRYGLMGTSVVLCLAIVYNCLNKKRAKSSFENRVTNASNALRSSMNLSSAQPQSSAQPSDDFSARVSEAAAELRRQLASTSPAPGGSYEPSSFEPSSSGMFTPPPVEDLSATNLSSSELAAKASAEISSFIAENS